MIQIHDNSFDTHSYISDLKATNNEEFRKKFTVFSEKYMLPDAKKIRLMLTAVIFSRRFFIFIPAVFD